MIAVHEDIFIVSREVEDCQTLSGTKGHEVATYHVLRPFTLHQFISTTLQSVIDHLRTLQWTFGRKVLQYVTLVQSLHQRLSGSISITSSQINLLHPSTLIPFWSTVPIH